MPHVHFFLNPKGGTGKSLFSYVFAQYLMSKNIKTQCIDCDPVTPTLNKYKALDVLYMDIMEGNDIQKTKVAGRLPLRCRQRYFKLRRSV